MSRNSELAATTLGHLAGLGVCQFVVCAGARNAPLVTSLLAAKKVKSFKVWHHFDERTAAFFALGLSRGRSEPVAVLTTSGTAAAELLPAAIEGYYTSVPLILVTADRPEWYRGSGAPQAIEQRGLFGVYAPLSIDVQRPEDLSWVIKWNRKAPMHLNVCFEEPRAVDCVTGFKTVVMPEPVAEDEGGIAEKIADFVRGRENPVCLLGSIPTGWRKAIKNFLKQSGMPFWAEATSGLRECMVLADQQVICESSISALRPDSVLRIGGVPSLRFWRELETLRGIEVLSVSPHPFPGLARPSVLITGNAFPAKIEVDTQKQEVDSAKRRLESVIEKFPRSEPSMMRAVAELIPKKAMVFLGNSMPIREWNLAAPFTPHPNCFASRGANGIDGEVATFLGLTEGEKESWGIFGDLTALYDLNAPGFLSQLPKGRRRFVVLNNGGGRIFSRLPSMAGLEGDEKLVTENHHRHRFEAWAEMWDMEYVVWRAGKTAPEVKGGNVLIEVLLENSATELFWKEMA